MSSIVSKHNDCNFNNQESAAEIFLLSVITINRNNITNLPKTISSLKQLRDDQDVECIFIDGASSDGSVFLAKNFWSEDKLISEPDSGIYNAMNKGLALARGKFVLWLNSGDELIPGAWPAAKQVIQTADASVIVFGLEIYNESGAKPIERRLPKAEMLPLRTLPHPSSIFRRDVVASLGGYDETFRIAADRHLFLALRQNDSVFCYSKIFLSKFYLGGISSRFFDTFFENRKIDHDFNNIGTFKYSLIEFAKKIYEFFVRRPH